MTNTCFVSFRLLNNFEYTSSDAHCIVKPDLVDNFVNSTNIKLSPRWFALIYKLFPGVCTVRRSVDGKFVYPLHWPHFLKAPK